MDSSSDHVSGILPHPPRQTPSYAYPASPKAHRALPTVPHKLVQQVATVAAIDETRPSSDTAIVRIYSMYEGGDRASNGTMSASASVNTGAAVRKSFTTWSEDGSNDSFFVQPARPSKDVPPPSTSSRRWSRTLVSTAATHEEAISASYPPMSGRRSPVLAENLNGYTHATPPLPAATNGRHIHRYLDEEKRSTMNGKPFGASRPTSYTPHIDGDTPGPSYHYSPQPSSNGHSTYESAPSTPLPTRVLSPPPPSPPSKSPERAYYRTASHEHLPESRVSPVPPQSKASSRVPSKASLRVPSRMPSQTPLQPLDPVDAITGPGSTTPEPLEGEDAESFHVRNTYAMLTRSGVHGDGYEDGVELTRARLNIDSTAAEASANVRHSRLTINGLMTGVSTKESSLLQSLDRYGFYTVPSHERLLMLPAAQLQKHLAVDNSTSSSASASPAYLSSTPVPLSPVKEGSRTAKWSRMLEPRSRDGGGNVLSWNVKVSKERKLRERVYKGIPDVWRRAAWATLAQRYSHASDQDLEKWKKEYEGTVEQPSKYDIQIDLDVPRTVSGHVMFRTRYGQGQRSLFHVLHCFSLRCSECGYVQGMGPIAATFLNYYEPESVYTSLVQLHDAYHMHAIFTPGFPGLLEQIYVQEQVMKTMLPGVYEAFKKHTVGTTSYATKWYITLFSNTMPFQTQLRLWDVFLLEGPDVFVMVATAVVWAFRDCILAPSATFESILTLLSASFVPEDEDVLLKWIEHALSDKKVRQNMIRWREQWHSLVARGEDRDALL